jgi:hypothetical protein
LLAWERLVPKPFASADLIAALRGLRPPAPRRLGPAAPARRALALAHSG